jgi:hypothetical protein
LRKYAGTGTARFSMGRTELKPAPKNLHYKKNKKNKNKNQN